MYRAVHRLQHDPGRGLGHAGDRPRPEDHHPGIRVRLRVRQHCAGHVGSRSRYARVMYVCIGL